MITPDIQSPRLSVPVDQHDHVRGSPAAMITLVEYGDFECPYCARAGTVVHAVEHHMGRRMRYVFRNFPLRTVHLYAETAAETAEAAAQQGKYWEMHDVLFRNQERLEPGDVIAYANALGLDTNRVASELTSHAHEHRVRSDFLGGVRSGVNGTPTFFINGRRYDGSWDETSLTLALERA